MAYLKQDITGQKIILEGGKGYFREYLTIVMPNEDLVLFYEDGVIERYNTDGELVE